MRLMTALLASALLFSGCGDVHTPGQTITGPSTPAPTPGAQAKLVLNASSRTDQQLDVTAQLLDGRGAGIPNVDVQFSITGGTVTPSTPVKTDATGTAKAIALTSGQATLSATTGALTSTAVVIGGVVPLALTLTIPSVIVGTASTLSAAVTGQPIGGAFTFAWTFGDGKSDTGTAGSIVHIYPGIGAYAATVKVTDGAGRSATSSASAVVTDVPAPAPTPGTTPTVNTLTVTLNCSQQPHGIATPTPCNVSATYGGTPIASNAITKVVWDYGDGTGSTVMNSPLVLITYAQAGMYNVTATVTATVTGVIPSPTATGSKSITVN